MKKHNLFFFILLSIRALAQDEFKLPVSVTLSGIYSPEQKFQKLSTLYGSYSNAAEALRFNIPLFQKSNTDKHQFFALMFLGSGACEQPSFYHLIQERQFIKFGGGLTTLYHFKKKHTLIGTFKMNVSEDQQTIYNPYYRTSGTLLYHNRCTSRFSFLLGGVVANNYKGVRFFPLLGMELRGNKRRFLMLFPLCFDYRYSITPKAAIGLRLSPKGNQSRFYTPAYDPSPLLDPESYLRIRHVDIAAYLRLDAGRCTSFCLQGGLMFANEIMLTTSEKAISSQLQSGPFISASFTYRFHKKAATADDPLSDELDTDDLNLYDITVDDLINY